MQTIYQRSAQRRSQISRRPTAGWRNNLPHWAVPLALGLMLLLILMSAGCAMLPTKQVVLDSCYVPTKELQPTPVPPLSDQTNGSLMQEANDSRDALTACNKDKADALKILTDQNKRRQS